MVVARRIRFVLADSGISVSSLAIMGGQLGLMGEDEFFGGGEELFREVGGVGLEEGGDGVVDATDDGTGLDAFSPLKLMLFAARWSRRGRTVLNRTSCRRSE